MTARQMPHVLRHPATPISFNRSGPERLQIVMIPIHPPQLQSESVEPRLRLPQEFAPGLGTRPEPKIPDLQDHISSHCTGELEGIAGRSGVAVKITHNENAHHDIVAHPGTSRQRD